MIKPSLLLAACLATSTLAGAAETQKPGLWSTTVKINMGQSMPQIDPAMIEQMKAMGIELPFVKPITREICLTPEQVARGTLPEVSDPQSGCATRNSKRAGDVLTGDLECSGQLKGKGTVKVQLTGPDTYTGSSSFKGEQEGLPVDMDTEFSGKWLGPQCGNVKPYGG